MRNWRYIWGEAWGSLVANPWMTVASLGSMAVAIMVLSIFVVFAANVNHLAGYLESQVQIRAFLADGLTVKQVASLQQKITAMPGVRQVSFVSKETALNQLEQEFGREKGLLAGESKANPLPASFSVKAAGPAEVATIAGKLAGLSGVTNVSYQAQTVERLFTLTKALRQIGAGLAILLIVATGFIIANTIRLAVFARRREIRIMKLVGASDGMIRGPFVIEGLILGTVGALLSAGVVFWGYWWLVRSAQKGLPFLPLLSWQLIAEILAGMVIVVGAGVGMLGSYLSLHRFLYSEERV